MAATSSRAPLSSTRTPSLGSAASLALSFWIASENGITRRPAVVGLAQAALVSGAFGVTVTVYLLPSSVVIEVFVAAAGGPGGVALPVPFDDDAAVVAGDPLLPV